MKILFGNKAIKIDWKVTENDWRRIAIAMGIIFRRRYYLLISLYPVCGVFLSDYNKVER